MQQYDFDKSVGFWLTVTTQAYHRAMIAELAPLGITYRQMQVIAWLKLQGELSQTELAARMLVEPPTLVGVLDRMERDGWLIREPSSTDRRKKLVRLLPAAEKLWSQVARCAKAMRCRATAGMDEEQVDMLRELLGRVRGNLCDESDGSDEFAAGETARGRGVEV